MTKETSVKSSFGRLMQQAIATASPQPNVLCIGGSPRRGGNSDVLMQHFSKGAGQNDISVDTIHLRDFSYQGCVGCERCRTDKICTGLRDGMSLLYPNIINCQGLILVSPTHNYNVTAWMKAFIDRLYCFYDFDDNRPRGWSSRLAGQGRKAVVAAICEQEHEDDMGFTLAAMRLPLQAMGYEIIGELPVLNIFDKANISRYNEVLSKAEKLGYDLAAALLS